MSKHSPLKPPPPPPPRRRLSLPSFVRHVVFAKNKSLRPPCQNPPRRLFLTRPFSLTSCNDWLSFSCLANPQASLLLFSWRSCPPRSRTFFLLSSGFSVFGFPNMDFVNECTTTFWPRRCSPCCCHFSSEFSFQPLRAWYLNSLSMFGQGVGPAPPVEAGFLPLRSPPRLCNQPVDNLLWVWFFANCRFFR